MFISKQGSISGVSMSEYSKDKSKGNENRTRTFYTEIMKSLRKGRPEYVFTQVQIQGIIKRLEGEEILIVSESDCGYIIQLATKQEKIALFEKYCFKNNLSYKDPESKRKFFEDTKMVVE